jgi:hypothetical protein
MGVINDEDDDSSSAFWEARINEPADDPEEWISGRETIDAAENWEPLVDEDQGTLHVWMPSGPSDGRWTAWGWSIEDLDEPDPGRRDRCWFCGTPVTEQLADCSECKWYICPRDGACWSPFRRKKQSDSRAGCRVQIQRLGIERYRAMVAERQSRDQ